MKDAAFSAMCLLSTIEGIFEARSGTNRGSAAAVVIISLRVLPSPYSRGIIVWPGKEEGEGREGIIFRWDDDLAYSSSSALIFTWQSLKKERGGEGEEKGRRRR